MADLSRLYAAADESVSIQTELEDPINMAYKFFVFAGAEEQAQQYAAIEKLFKSLSQENWDENWDQRCENANISIIKNYLELALKFLADISDTDGKLIEPFHGKFKAVDQYELWESGFFYWEKENQVKPREFITALKEFTTFLDKVNSSGCDLLRRIED
jgi:hypothetical protein